MLPIPRLTAIKENFTTADGSTRLSEVFQHAQRRMENGENENITEDYFRYHRYKMPPKAMAAVHMVEITEMLVEEMRDRRFKVEGSFTNALIETLCIQPREMKNPLFKLIAHPKQANFVIGYEGFSEELQQIVAQKLRQL